MNIHNRIIVGVLLLLTVFSIGTGGYWVISGDVLDALYMTVITAATVGYGEVIDLTHNPAGKIFTIIFIVLSIMTIAAITSLMAASILELELKSGFLRRRKMNKEISKLSNHYIICGAGQNGIHVIREIAKTLKNYVVIDLGEERLKKIAKTIPGMHYIAGDATEDETLITAGIERSAGIIAALPSDKDNLYITVMAKQYNSCARIVALGVEDKAINKLKKAGADSVVSPSMIGGLRMASEMVRPSAVKFLDTMLRQKTGTYRIEEITINPDSIVLNKKLSELPLKDKFDALVLAIMRNGSDEVLYNPPANTVLSIDSIIVVIGETSKIQEARKYMKCEDDESTTSRE